MHATSTITYGHTPSAPRPSAITTSCTLRMAPLRSTTPQRRRRLLWPGSTQACRRARSTADRARLGVEQLGAGPRAEHRAAREVLHLALAIDRRVGDHRHRLLEVVGQVLPLLRQARKRAVVAERADRLRAGRGHLLHELHVV